MGAGDFTGRLLWSKAGTYVCVLFSRDGGLIWSVDRLDEENLRISLFHSGDGTLAHSLDLEDPFGDSALRLMDIPGSGAVTLELAAGQDGISVYELFIQQDGLCSREMFPQGCYLSPAWHPDGSQLFTLENDAQVYACFSYPALELLEEQGMNDGDSLNDDPSLYSQLQSCERVGSLLIFRTGSLHDIPHLLLIEEVALLEAIGSMLTRPHG